MRRSTDWRTGLYAGGILNTFERDSLVAMATPALWLRHVTAPAWDNALHQFRQPLLVPRAELRRDEALPRSFRAGIIEG